MINPRVLNRTTRPASSCAPCRRAAVNAVAAEDGLSITSALFEGVIEDVDPRLSRALGYPCPVYVSRQVWDLVIDRDDDPEHTDQTMRLVDLLWTAKTSLDGHPWPTTVPVTVFPVDAVKPYRVNIDANRESGDMGEQIITLTQSEIRPTFTVPVAGDRLPLPALDYEIGGGRITPRVTVQILHVVLAALTDAELVAAFHVQDCPDNPVEVTLTDGRTTTLRSHQDGSYSLGLLAEFTTTAA